MRVLPVLLNTTMVLAVLEGHKTAMRRTAKKIPVETYRIEEIQLSDSYRYFECYWGGYMPDVSGFVEGSCVVLPPYREGDILYVRETWSEWTDGYVYKAWPGPFPQPGESRAEYMTWHPSIHMPKEAARIWLKVTDIRPERLRDITADGIREEGLLSMTVPCGDMKIAQEEFAVLWNSTVKKPDIGRYGWSANPWVWVIKFERCGKPDWWDIR